MILQTRLELITVEVEKESLRLLSHLMFAIAAMFCIGMTLLLRVLLIVVFYWDTQRVPVLVTLMLFCALSSATIILGTRKHYRMKPRMLSHTLQELSMDIEQMNPEHRETGL